MPVSRRCPWRRQVRRSTTSLPQCGPWPRPWTPPAWRRHRERHGSMEWFQAVVLGVLQGLTEFLPISSSAHLRIFPELFGWEDPGASFTAVTQIGTETAVILDRKSTRLNSSHVAISYAVFCLNKRQPE